MKRNRLLGLLAAGVLSAGVLLAPAAAFTDTTGHWAEGAINQWSQNYGIIQGYEDGTFRPDNSITRGAFAGILDRFFHFLAVSPAGTFSDLAGNYWEQEILKLNAAGVYLGNNGKALAADSITRQQAVTMVARAFGIQSTTSVLPYTDAASVSEYAIPAVAEFTARGWLNDSTDGRFRPTDPITRAEIVHLFSNMIQLLIQTPGTYSENVDGSVMISSTDGATLTHMTVTGDLILAPGVTGPVTLDSVTVGGTVRNLSAVEPLIVNDPAQPEDPETPVIPVDPENPDQTEDPGTSETPDNPDAIQPSEVYTPGVTTGETIGYDGKQIPVYADRPKSQFAQGDFVWEDDRLAYVGNDFSTRFGVDVSAYQNRATEGQVIDWNAARNDGVEFAMVRVGLRGYSSGAIVEDAFWEQNVRGALEAGIETGVYFFAQAITVEEAIEEADYVISLLDRLDVELTGPVAYDWEMHDSTYRVYGTTPEMATACAAAFCQRIAEAGYTPMVYAGQYVSYIKYDQGALAPYLSWYPEYKSASSENLYPTLYYHMDYWQFSSSCTVDGIGGRVDANLQFLPR